MPLYSQKQINKVQLLLSERNMDVNDIVDAMDCSVRDAWALIKLAKQTIKIKEQNPVIERPKAEYSNTRSYDLI